MALASPRCGLQEGEAVVEVRVCVAACPLAGVPVSVCGCVCLVRVMQLQAEVSLSPLPAALLVLALALLLEQVGVHPSVERVPSQSVVAQLSASAF